ncbi:transposase [Anaerotignum propionicum]|uniref:transposase n=1 Tax=Anaerotignum propionicum TaxID=28446 RepID=UPI00289BBD1A|nr:transposase [Anaerotignum propionicum]
MYSFEEHKIAINLYSKYDLEVNPVLKVLGYPSSRILYKWHKEFANQGGFLKRHTRKSIYSDEQKKLAIDYYLNHGKSLATTIRHLGYPSRIALSSWIKSTSLFLGKSCDTSKYKVRFSFNKRKQAVFNLCQKNTSGENIPKSHGIPKSTLYQ